jgi:hypothetical protein
MVRTIGQPQTLVTRPAVVDRQFVRDGGAVTE